MTKGTTTHRDCFRDIIKLADSLLADDKTLNTINMVAGEITKTFKGNRKLLLCGNGGSAAEAQHLAAEFSGRFLLDRKPLFAEALNVNTSYLTAVANDYGFEHVFSRSILAQGQPGDILVVLTTSGNSKNIVEAVRTANDLGLITIALTGSMQGELDVLCRYVIKVPSEETPRVQEIHLIVGHIICEIVESELFNA